MLHILRIGSYIVLWYFFSTCLSLYNKHLVGQSHYGLPYPLLTSSVHAFMQWILSTILLQFMAIPKRHTTRTSTTASTTSATTSSSENEKKRSSYWLGLIPCGIATGFDIGFSNASLMFISLTFYTMCKSTTPMWCLLFAILFGLEQFSLSHFFVILMVATGAVLTVMGETVFNLRGFILIMLGASSSGFRWALTQVLLQKQTNGIHHPLLTLNQLAPISCLSLLFLSLIQEDPFLWFAYATDTNSEHSNVDTTFLNVTRDSFALRHVHTGVHQHFGSWTMCLETLWLMSIGGVLAFCMILSEFMLIGMTSVLTLSIAGTCKEVVVIAAAMGVYGETMSPLNYAGVMITIIGVLWYNWTKFKQRNSDSSDTRHHGGYERIIAVKTGMKLEV